MIETFAEFINEDFFYTTDIITDFTFGDRWFYYEEDDEILYGCDEQPVDIKSLFYFNPKTCSIYVGDKKVEYDINNPLCLIRYFYKDDEIKIYKDDDVIKYFDSIGHNINGDILSKNNRNKIQNLFVEQEEKGKQILIYGTELLASTFDIIEEKEGES